jgi:DnaJ like chaperone protein
LVYGALAYLVYKYVTSDSDKKKKNGQKRVPEKRAPTAAAASKPSPHEVLGVDADAGEDEIRRAYQDKMRQYHPDRVAGAGQELRDLAEKRSKEINAAYDALMRR